MIPACVRGLAGGLAMAALFILTVARRENRRDANSIATAHRIDRLPTWTEDGQRGWTPTTRRFDIFDED